MTGYEKFRFNLKRFINRVKTRNHRKTIQESWLRHKARVDKLVKETIVEGKSYKIWDTEIPADRITEWEIRYLGYAIQDFDHDDIFRWFHDKIEEIYLDD